MTQRLTTLLSASVFACTMASQAFADDTHGKRYASVDIGFYGLESDNGNFEADLTHISGRVGGYLNDNLALEARLGTGVTDDTINEGIFTDTDISLRYLVGAYMRIGAKAGDQLFPYLLLGFTRADFETETGSNSSNDAETDTSYGAGIDFNLSGLTVALEYANLVDKNDSTYSGFSIGLKSTF
ncbi:MAG: porin family protein [Oleiphilaceae bacterium]|nr:porin family protein [Oleiphilaceae bacterium]